MTKINTHRLVESAILIAMGFLLSFIKIEIFPETSISLLSMLPVFILAYKYGTSWGLLCGLVHGLLQMVEGGISTPPTEDIWGFILVILLDYILAFSFLGLAGLARNVSKNPSVAISVCCALGIASRFICSLLSGAIIWGVYAPEGQSPWVYSLVVNGTKFGIEGIFTIIVAAILLAIPVMQKNTRPINSDKSILNSPSL
ncbi:MAG: energy-coupled thiamine transporter ThiT [Oscillospiraceae bacterium]